MRDTCPPMKTLKTTVPRLQLYSYMKKDVKRATAGALALAWVSGELAASAKNRKVARFALPVF